LSVDMIFLGAAIFSVSFQPVPSRPVESAQHTYDLGNFRSSRDCVCRWQHSKSNIRYSTDNSWL
jgi:hypothetical protein